MIIRLTKFSVDHHFCDEKAELKICDRLETIK